jgi:hypothetical protein
MTLAATIKILFASFTNTVRLSWTLLWSPTMSVQFFTKLAPYLAGTGATLINLDENEIGTDDVAGQLLIYAADVISSVSNDEDLPALPDVLSQVIAGKLSGPARTAIILASGPLSIAQFQLAATHPRASKALRYVAQVLNAIAAGKPVPPAPSL